MTTAERHPAARWPTRTLLAGLMLPNVLAWWYAAGETSDHWSFAAQRAVFSNHYTAGALLAVMVAASIAIIWLAILTWSAAHVRRIHLTLFYTLACVILWVASVSLGAVPLNIAGGLSGG